MRISDWSSDVCSSDLLAPLPQSSYGAQKAMAELLINDYSRKGFIDGRVCRLPTISVRPGKPNAAASSFASGILREPLAGEASHCPDRKSTSLNSSHYCAHRLLSFA